MKKGFPTTLLRYVSGEMARTVSLTLVVVTLLWVFVITLQLVRHHAVGPRVFAMVVPLLTVISLAYTLPIAILFGVSIAYGRLSTENEFRAMAWNGVHLGWTILPAAALAVAATFVSLFVSTQAMPYALQKRDTLISSSVMAVVRNRFIVAAQSGEAVKFNRTSLTLQSYDSKTGTAIGVNIIVVDREKNWQVTLSLSADAARVVEGKVEGAMEFSRDPDKPQHLRRYISFIFTNGRIQEYDPDARLKVITTMPAPPIAVDVSKNVNRIEIKQMGLTRLAAYAREADSDKNRNKARTLLFERLALGMSPFFFALVAAPMAMVAKWKHMLTSFLPSLVLASGVYYPLVMWAKVQGEAGTVDPALGMFAGNALMLIISVILTLVVLRK